VLTTTSAASHRLKMLKDAGVHLGQFGSREVDFKAALTWLHDRWKVRHLHCEGGGELNDAMFRAGLVDELYVTLCPFVFGGNQAPTIAEGQGFERLAEATQLEFVSIRQEGSELFLKLRRISASIRSLHRGSNPTSTFSDVI